MSMNVADSTDLIHGGGGSLSNFWRSRTDFEQKLLVAMTVMTLVIIGMTIAVIVLAVENGKKNPASNPAKIDGRPNYIKSTAGAKEAPVAVPEEALNEIGKTASPNRIASTASRYKGTSEPKTLQSKDAPLQEEALLTPSNSNEEHQDDSVIHEHSSPNQAYITERLLMSL